VTVLSGLGLDAFVEVGAFSVLQPSGRGAVRKPESDIPKSKPNPLVSRKIKRDTRAWRHYKGKLKAADPKGYKVMKDSGWNVKSDESAFEYDSED